MTAGKEAPIGEWESPITSELIVSSSIRLGAPVIANNAVYWNEGRPQEAGRQVLVKWAPSGAVSDITPAPESGFNVRTRVHEYGGGEYVVGAEKVYFSNFKDQQVYQQQLGGEAAAPEPLTTDPKLRFADAVIDTAHSRLVAVREDHSSKGEAVNTIAAVDLASGESGVLVGGRDFFSSPRVSPDGARLAWVCWDHPNMPWDDTELWVADVAPDGSLSGKRKVAGGEDESVLQPVWSADGQLYFISDRTGWWNIYREAAPGEVSPVLSMDAEFAGPAWVFGQRSYQFLPNGKLLAICSDPKAAGAKLLVVDPQSGAYEEIKSDYYTYGSLSIGQIGDKLVVATVGGSPKKPTAIALLEADSADQLASGTWRELRKASGVTVDEKYLSAPSVIEFPTTGGLTAFMNYYPPKNDDFELPAGQAAPLLVTIHGGPTAAAAANFSLLTQYWTSRGYGIADVNYGGSTGYGRAYRNRLRGSWGVVDVDDCCNAARHLAAQGMADPTRLCISGGSAGGYTTLACLAFRDVFKAGASLYGVADLELLATETHKFESRYLDTLIGKLPEAKAIYTERSPIHALDKFDTPIAFFQGLEDEIVPPNQAEIMYDAIAKKGVPAALVMFEGEQHGFRGAKNIRRALDGEFYFYSKALGFKSSWPSDLEPIEVVNV